MLAVAITAEATTAVAHAPPTQVSQGKTQVTVAVVANRAASVAPKAHAHHTAISHVCRATKYNAKTHAAPALTWANSAMTLTNASQPAMCQQASHHLACPRAAVVVAEAVTVVATEVAVAAVAETSAEGVAVAIQAVGLVAGLGANQTEDCD